MCTTASLCVGVAFLCGVVSTVPCREQVDGAMSVAHRGHRNLERRRCRGEHGVGRCMLSVHDVLSLSMIDLEGLGLERREYIVLPRAQSSPGTPSPRAEAGSAFERAPARCLVAPEDIAGLMRPAERGSPTMAVLTGRGHSVCLMLAGDQTFSTFDPATGILQHGMDAPSFEAQAAALTAG